MKRLKVPRKYFGYSMIYSEKAWELGKFDLLDKQIDDLFDELKKKAKQSLAQERIKRKQDGVIIKAWIIPNSKI